jgi:hypothetical protein
MKIAPNPTRVMEAKTLAAQPSATSCATLLSPAAKVLGPIVCNDPTQGLGFVRNLVAAIPSANPYLHGMAPKTPAEARAFESSAALFRAVTDHISAGASKDVQIAMGQAQLQVELLAKAVATKAESVPANPIALALSQGSLPFGGAGGAVGLNRLGLLPWQTFIPGQGGIKVGGTPLPSATLAPLVDHTSPLANRRGFVALGGEGTWTGRKWEKREGLGESAVSYRDMFDLFADVSPEVDVGVSGFDLAHEALELYQHRRELHDGDREVIGQVVRIGGMLIMFIPAAASIFGVHLGTLGHIMTVGGAGLSIGGSLYAGKPPEFGDVAKFFGLPDNVTLMTRLQLIQTKPLYAGQLTQFQNLLRAQHSHSLRAAYA